MTAPRSGLAWLAGAVSVLAAAMVLSAFLLLVVWGPSWAYHGTAGSHAARLVLLALVAAGVIGSNIATTAAELRMLRTGEWRHRRELLIANIVSSVVLLIAPFLGGLVWTWLAWTPASILVAPHVHMLRRLPEAGTVKYAIMSCISALIASSLIYAMLVFGAGPAFV